MIEKKTVCQIVEEWLEGKDYFLVEVTVSPDDKIVVEIDHAEGVWIEDCVELSRYIESKLNREEEDYELEVGSAGIGQPFKVLQQYYIHIGQEVEVMTKGGQKLTGVLKHADEEKFTVSVQKKVKMEGAKRPKLVEEDETFTYEQIKYTVFFQFQNLGSQCLAEIQDSTTTEFGKDHFVSHLFTHLIGSVDFLRFTQ
jgi:ribosome maturation factor RimP